MQIVLQYDDADRTKLVFANHILWALATLAVKISILHLYNHLFPTRALRIVSYSAMALSTCVCLMAVLSALLLCRPIALIWDHTLKGSCGSLHTSWLSQAIVVLFIDAIVVVIPAPVLFRLQIPTEKKFGIYFMFSIGIGYVTSSRLYGAYRILTISGSFSLQPYVSVPFCSWTCRTSPTAPTRS